jgi:hypothetical protein
MGYATAALVSGWWFSFARFWLKQSCDHHKSERWKHIGETLIEKFKE